VRTPRDLTDTPRLLRAERVPFEHRASLGSAIDQLLLAYCASMVLLLLRTSGFHNLMKSTGWARIVEEVAHLFRTHADGTYALKVALVLASLRITIPLSQPPHKQPTSARQFMGRLFDIWELLLRAVGAIDL